MVFLTPIKQEYYSKFRLLINRLIFSLKLSVYPGSISCISCFKCISLKFKRTLRTYWGLNYTSHKFII